MMGTSTPLVLTTLFVLLGASVSAYNILYVGQTANPTAGSDEYVIEHLEDAGHTVTYVQDDYAAESDANGKDLVMVILWPLSSSDDISQISSTTHSDYVRGKWVNSSVGVVTWEFDLVWDMPDNFRLVKTYVFLEFSYHMII